MGEMEPKHRKYLNELRRSGVTNMYGAGPYLQREFGLERSEAHAILAEWMAAFDPAVDSEGDGPAVEGM